MKTGKEIILEYCKSVVSYSIEFLEACNNIKDCLSGKEYAKDYIDDYCFSTFIEDDFKGFVKECKINPIKYPEGQYGCDGIYEQRSQQCKLCWENALKKEFEGDEYISKEEKIKNLLLAYKLSCFSLANSLDDTEVEEEITQNLKEIELEIIKLIE